MYRMLGAGIVVLLGGAACHAEPPRGDAVEGPAAREGGKSSPSAPVVRDDLREAFVRAGLAGGFALVDVSRGRTTVVDRQRAEQRRMPASTFKIPHSLIALETGVVEDENEVVPYGGEPQRLPQWEQDQSMRDAIEISNVAVYRTIARRIGVDREKRWLERLGYGNREVDTVDRVFWRDGPLEISAVEQAVFMGRLAGRRLPASAEHQRTVSDMVKVEEKNGYALFGKSGWADAPRPQVGWWAGWVERDGHVYGFALTIDINRDADAEKRLPLVRDLLHRLGVLPQK
ncbi:penicillin-binding transpeptidase domain-containing protein [Actinomadura sp. LOL_016]|uniref:penicillin-binding transpeptidase domain-containing protein n=1 Tax=unclassified Actinomadura TaxID=2626254 RepID=UPI003A805006